MQKRLTLLALLFSLSTGMAFSQLLNGDFESWEPNGGQAYPTGWPSLSSASNIQSTQSINGNYSLLLNAWYYYTETSARQEGPISQPYSVFSGGIKYKSFRNALIISPDTITRYNDTAWVEIYMTHWDAVLQRRDTVGEGIGSFTSNSSDSLLVAFQIPIQYSSSVLPDSFRLLIDPSMIYRNPNISYFVADPSGNSSFLTVDDLHFSNGLSLSDPASEDAMRFFPNPGQDRIYLQISRNGTASLWGIQGEQLLRCDVVGMEEVQWNVSDLPAGVYWIRLEEAETGAIESQVWIKQ